MILDTMEQLSAAQSVAAVVSDIPSTNTYDTGVAMDVGAGEPMWAFVKLVAALAGAGSSIQAVLQDSADNATFADVQAGPVVALANAVANKVLMKARFPVGLRRYLRIVYRISGATSSGGTANAYFIKDVEALQYGASGFTVA